MQPCDQIEIDLTAPPFWADLRSLWIFPFLLVRLLLAINLNAQATTALRLDPWISSRYFCALCRPDRDASVGRRIRQRVKPGRILGLWEPYGVCSGIIQPLARKQDNRGAEKSGGFDRKPRC